MDTDAIATWNVYDAWCPTRMALDRIADGWTVLIVGRLSQRTLRFGQLKKQTSGISSKVLTRKLRALERDGIIERKVYASVPPKVEYSLTPLGQTLVDVLNDIRVWAETHIESVLEAQEVFDCRPAAED